MEEKDKDINIVFKPQIGFGDVLFSFNKEEEVLKILGAFSERNVDIFDDIEYAIHLDYWNLDMSVSLYFENNKFDYLSIHTRNIILDGFRFSLHNQIEILSFIKKYHNVHKLDFIEKIENIETVNEICYTYNTIGLTIWFDKIGISGISVWKTH